jgi:O-antigen ligase
MLIRLLPIWLYLAALFIAPQLWVRSMLNWPVDFFIYPFWLFVLLVRGKLGRFFQIGVPDKFFLGLIVWMVLSWVTNGPPAAAPLILINYVKWFVLYRLVVASIDSSAALRHVGIVIIVLAGTIAIQAAQHLNSITGIGWAGQSFGWVDPSAESIGLDARTRWVGIFDGPGVFCVMFTIALPFVLQYFSKAYPFWKRFFAAALLAPLFGYAIYSTGSRGGILATLAVCGCWVISRYRISFDKLVWIAVGGAVFMVLGPAYLTSATDSNKSAQHRVDMWVEGIEMVQQNPVFGIGKGKFGSYTGKLIAHNSGIENMGEMGMPGLFLWIGLIYFGMKCLVARYIESQDGRERELLTALGICVIGYLVSSLFVTLEYETWYFILALTAAVGNWTSTPTTIDRRDLINIGATAIGFFALIKAFVMVY